MFLTERALDGMVDHLCEEDIKKTQASRERYDKEISIHYDRKHIRKSISRHDKPSTV